MDAHKLPLRSGHGLVLTPKPCPKTVLESDICLSLKWGHVYSDNTEVWVSLSRDTLWQPPASSLVETQPAIESFHSFPFPLYLNVSSSWAILASPNSEWTSGIQQPFVEIIPASVWCPRDRSTMKPTRGWWFCQWLILHIVLEQNLSLSLWPLFQTDPVTPCPLPPPHTRS